MTEAAPLAMPALLKAGQAHQKQMLVRAFASEAAAPPPPSAETLEIAALQADNDSLRRALETAKHKFQTDLEAARLEGEAEALRAFKRDQEAALASLEQGLREAVAAAKARLNEIESVALLLCQTALESVFADSKDLQSLTARALKLQMQSVRRESIMRVTVSAAEFGDPAALSKLADNVLAGSISIEASSELTPGEARIAMQLGDIELSVPDHWRNLRAALARLAGAETP